MEDDIDIEEHDILENPRIKGILPHFVIKSEPIDLDTEEFEDSIENYEENNYFEAKQETEDWEDDGFDDFTDMPSEPLRSRSPPTDHSDEIYHHNNVIILGSKPCQPIVETEAWTEASEYLEPSAEAVAVQECNNDPQVSINTEQTDQPIIVQAHSSKEIVCRPCPKSKKPFMMQQNDRAPLLRSLLTETEDMDSYNSDRPERVLEDAIVLLEDWGSRLNSSRCYCKKCETLFATRNALDAHDMTAHSFLVAMDIPEEPVSPERPISPKIEETPANKRYCNHCQRYFSNDNLLIQHLYEHLTVKSAKVESNILYFRCPVCTLYYTSLQRFIFHTMKNHGAKFENVKKVPFKSTCLICNSKINSLVSYKKHVSRLHSEYRKKVNNALSSNNQQKPSFVNNLSSRVVSYKSEEANAKVKGGKSLPKGAVTKTKVLPKGAVTKTKVLPKGAVTKTKFFPKFTWAWPKNFVRKGDKFKCVECKTLCSSRQAVFNHMHRKHHNELKRVFIRNQTEPPKPAKPVKPKLAKKTNQFVHYKTVLPKSLIFKCLKCGLFVLCAGATDHHKICAKPPASQLWSCDKCGRRMRLLDKDLHLKQHALSTNIRTYSFSGSIYSKVLCKCWECNIYFMERPFLRHRFDGCSATDAGWCAVCKVTVAHLPTHERNHTEKKSKSDFIFIDDFFMRDQDINEHDVTKLNSVDSPTKLKLSSPSSSAVPDSLKRKLPPSESETPSKKPKSSSKPLLYYCDLCGTYSKFWREFHVQKECLKKINRLAYCTHCGLGLRIGMPMQKHREDHLKYKWKLKDFVFLSFRDGKPVSPPLPKYPTCKKCNAHYMCPSIAHKCQERKRKCTVCNTTFDVAAYKFHMLHHKFMTPSNDIDEVSELIQKYESLNTTWNIIYQCSSCHIATDSYDRAIEHSQQHIALPKTQSGKECDICSIQFDEFSFRKHKEIHANENINKSSFNIFTYEYADLLTNNWFKLFKNLSKANIKQITSTSIYVTRVIKMNVILNGPPEYTIYKCEACKNYVDSQAVLGHANNCSTQGKPHPCNVCHIPFSSEEGLKNHTQIHSNTNITANSYRIVSFNSKLDEIFNDNLRHFGFDEDDDIVDSSASFQDDNLEVTYYQCLKCRFSSSDKKCFVNHSCDCELWSCHLCPCYVMPDAKQAHIDWHKANKESSISIKLVSCKPGARLDRVKRFHVWYQCFSCHVLLSNPQMTHDCEARHLMRQCSKCKHKFHTQSFKLHEAQHLRNPLMKTKDLMILPVDHYKKVTLVEDKPLTLLKGKSDLGYSKKTPKNTPEKHFEELPSSNEIASDCGSVATPEAKSKTITIDSTVYDNTLYKCWCGLHFLAHGTLLDHSLLKDHRRSSRVTCPQCDYVFTSNSHGKHVKIHHTMLGLSRDDIVVSFENIVAVPKSLEMLKRSSGDRIYECNKCKINFCKFGPAKRHYIACLLPDPTAEQTSSCEHCGLFFPEKYLTQHTRDHHTRRQRDLSVFVVKTFSEDDLPLLEGKVEVDVTDIKVEMKQEKDTPSRRKFVTELYKCSVCGMHYVERSSLDEHCRGNHDENKVECMACNLEFSSDELVAHASQHHDVLKLKRKDFKIINHPDVDTTIDASLVSLDSSKLESSVCESDATTKPPNNVVFKCRKCEIVYINSRTAAAHTQNHSGFATNCDLCGLKFTQQSLDRHKEVHHARGVTELACVMLDDVYNDKAEINLSKRNAIYKCVTCNMHFVCWTGLAAHIQDGNHPLPTNHCHVCGLAFTKLTMGRHIACHHTQRCMKLEDFDIQTLEIVTVSIDKSKDTIANTSNTNGPDLEDEVTDVQGNVSQIDRSDVLDDTAVDKDVNESAVSQSSDHEATSSDKIKKRKISPTTLYKCGPCNVYFLKQNSCYKHTLNHVPMDAMDYIECKLCSLQFKVMSLGTHVKKHHKGNFELSNVLVEEYQPKVKGDKTPKIDIYYAKDKDQSRLVSTTTEDENTGKIVQDTIEGNSEAVTSETSEFLKTDNDTNDNNDSGNAKIVQDPLEEPSDTLIDKKYDDASDNVSENTNTCQSKEFLTAVDSLNDSTTVNIVSGLEKEFDIALPDKDVESNANSSDNIETNPITFDVIKHALPTTLNATSDREVLNELAENDCNLNSLNKTGLTDTSNADIL